MKYIFLLFFMFNTLYPSGHNHMDEIELCRLRVYILLSDLVNRQELRDRVYRHELPVYKKTKEELRISRIKRREEYKKIKKHCGIKGYIYQR